MQDALIALHGKTQDPNVAALRMGIGIHSGPLVEGNVGTRDRVKHAVIGDTVNTASRIQDRSRDGKGTCVLISAATREEIEPYFDLDFFGEERLKGLSAPVPIWEVVALKAQTRRLPPEEARTLGA
jgi:adenylate cyclase